MIFPGPERSGPRARAEPDRNRTLAGSATLVWSPDTRGWIRGGYDPKLISSAFLNGVSRHRDEAHAVTGRGRSGRDRPRAAYFPFVPFVSSRMSRRGNVFSYAWYISLYSVRTASICRATSFRAAATTAVRSSGVILRADR